MGDLIPFRRKRKWTRPSDYGHVLPTRQWRGTGPNRKPSRAWLKTWLPLAAIIGVSIWLGFRDTAVPAPDAQSETISPPFTVCAERHGANCVVDGDTIRLGARTIRLLGFDAPELHPPRCMDEARKGLEAQARLLQLLNSGPVKLTGANPLGQDEYGRELAHLVRVRPDGSFDAIESEMIASGTVRAYTGGARLPWC